MGEFDALLTSILGGGVAVGVIRLLLSAATAALERHKDRRPNQRSTDLMDDYEGLVDRLQHQIEVMQSQLERMAARITVLEASEARLQVELGIARDTYRVQLERVYAELEQTRIRLAAVERENAKLRGLMVPEEEGE